MKQSEYLHLWTEDTLRQEFELTLSERISRINKVKYLPYVPANPFSRAEAECFKMFRDGCFYGCIALTQAVVEAIIRNIHKQHFGRAGKFERNLTNLSRQGKISDDLTEAAKKIWEGRNDYHHLNKSISDDPRRLEELAMEKTLLLAKIEKLVFTIPTTGDVFLRIDI